MPGVQATIGRRWSAAESSGGDDAEPDDRASAERARTDRTAFAPLYDRYADRVYRFCCRRLGEREAAEDATSQIFAQALAGLPGYRGGSFRAWLFAIAHNVCANAHRRRPELPLDQAASVADRSSSAAPEAQALAALDADALRSQVAALPPDQRLVVELRLAGLTGVEIAEAIGRSHAAVKMLQARAFVRLRAALGDGDRDGGTDGRA